MNRFYFILISFLFLFTSCEKDDASSSGTYTTGVFFVNQGPFQNGTGSITHWDETTNVLTQDVFSKENSGLVLGNIAQSIIKFGGLYFIAINNGATVQMVNSADFKSVGEIKNISLPRYFASNDQKLYLSAWGSDFNSGKIYQLDANKKSAVDSIVVGGAPETMLIDGTKLYVTVATTFAAKSKKVIVIETQTNKVIKTIISEDNPNAISKDNNGNIWVLCSGNIDYVDPSKSTFGKLVKINNDVIISTFPLEFEALGLAINKEGDRVYFTMNNKVYVHDVTDASFEKESIFNGYFYSIAFQKAKNKLFLTDPKDFSSQGEVVIYDVASKSTNKLSLGIAPGFTYFSE